MHQTFDGQSLYVSIYQPKEQRENQLRAKFDNREWENKIKAQFNGLPLSKQPNLTLLIQNLLGEIENRQMQQMPQSNYNPNYKRGKN